MDASLVAPTAWGSSQVVLGKRWHPFMLWRLSARGSAACPMTSADKSGLAYWRVWVSPCPFFIAISLSTMRKRSNLKDRDPRRLPAASLLGFALLYAAGP